jgi:hypothetical protein
MNVETLKPALQERCLAAMGVSPSDNYWQDGYGAFSVNPGEVEIVIDYISRQKELHTKKTFQDEYRAFLKKYKVEYETLRLGLIITIYRPFRAFV